MKHIMKNFKVKHGQCGNIIFSRAFSFESSKWLLDLCLDDSRILCFWQILESTKGGSIISNFTKGETFSSLMTTKFSWGLLGINLKMWPLFLHPPGKELLLPFSLAKKRIGLDTQLNESLLICFWKLPGCSLFPQAE